jgi:hypothetical protein
MPEIQGLEWSDSFTYFWNPVTDETFRVSDDSVEEFAGDAWTATTVEKGDIVRLPQVDSIDTLNTIVASAADATPAAEALPEGAGGRFRIPVVIPEGVPSGDRRVVRNGALDFKEPPMPLMWQRQTSEGHNNSVTVGKITSIERLSTGGLGNAEGVFDTHADAVEAARQVREKFLTGVSGDLDMFEAELAVDEAGSESIDIQKGRLVGATLVAKPAFQEAYIEFISDEQVILASAGPMTPPAEWFNDPGLSEATRLSVTDDGRVYGHIATWGTSHLGNPSVKPPRSRSNYKHFNAKPLRVSTGRDVLVGQLTLAGGHADLHLSAKTAVEHYDNTQSAVADVIAGEDEFGIWVAGAMRPDVTDFQVRAFRASDPSGDWRQIDGALELVAVCQVNVPGFPVARTLVASGEPLALVAAGADMYRSEAPTLQSIVASLTNRLETLETAERARRITALRDKISRLRR